MPFYAHYYQDESTELRKQTVTEHCRNTAAYAKNVLAPIGLGDSGYLAGLLHDMGKMKQEFQDYLLGNVGKRGSVNHTFAGCRFLLTQFHADQATACEDLTAELLAFAVGAHHGLFDCLNQEGESGFLHRVEKEGIGYQECLDNFLTECADLCELKELFCFSNVELTSMYERLGVLAKDNDEEYLFYQSLLGRLLLSAVIEGDRRDTGAFCSRISVPEEPSDYKHFWEPYLAHVEEKLGQFEKNTEIQRARATISQKCYDYGENQGGVIRLNVPTGGGKTLSSLRFALNHAKKWGKRRIIFTAPLLTILDQNAPTIKEYLGNESIVLEHHSNVVHTVENSELDDRELLMDGWYSPVIVTTMVQLLNTLFAGKTTSIRRFQSLCKSVIVIDEVQTVPSKMLTLFNLAVNFLAHVCDATVVLCSATQPCLERVLHPLCPIPEKMVPFDQALWKPFQRTKIVDAGRMTMEETVGFIREAMEQVRSLLVVCNKKDQAAYFVRALDDVAEVCVHLSAAMCQEHRRKNLEQLTCALESGKRCLCIATQVIEAGVDISFQRVIRLAAGMDSVIQAAGRCNRNAEECQVPVYIVTLLDENLGRLEDIQRAKTATVSLLEAYRREPEQFDSDLASEKAIDFYYNRFYGAMKQGAQDYPLARERSSIFRLLSDNRDYCDDTKSFYGRFMLNQAFRMAGNAFTVFESDTQDVVVPYGYGKKLIEELAAKGTADVEFLEKWLPKAKPYTVSLFAYQIQELSDVIAEYGGVMVLPQEYYNERTGFTLRPGKFDYWEV